MKKYLVNGFHFFYDALKDNLDDYAVNYLFPKPSFVDFITNYLLYRKLQKSGKIKAYDIVHINTWENFFNYQKIPGQIGIGESHGFHLGLNFDQTIKQMPIVRRVLSKALKFVLTKKILRKIHEFDIYYVSTPNMLVHAKKLRKDAKWLPNPINTRVFRPDGKKIRLKGDPAVFFPTKFHAAKNPAFAISLFKKIKKKYPKACLHYIKYGLKNSPLERDFWLDFCDKGTYITHDTMNPSELAVMYRSADIVLGHFNTDLGCLCLIELESMACRAPLVSFDNHELKFSLDDAEKTAFRLLEDPLFRKEFIERNYRYLMSVHSGKAVANKVLSDINSLKGKNL